MKKKIVPLIIIICLIGGILFWKVLKDGNSFDASIAIACSGQEYVEIEGNGYLTFMMADGKTSKRLMVVDEDIKALLLSSNIKDIIGLHIILHIPKEIVKEHHLNTKSLNAIYLMESSTFDTYFTIVDVSFQQKN